MLEIKEKENENIVNMIYKIRGKKFEVEIFDLKYK